MKNNNQTLVVFICTFFLLSLGFAIALEAQKLDYNRALKRCKVECPYLLD